IGADHDVVFVAVGAQGFDLLLRHVGTVSDPDYAVVHAVHGVPVLNGLWVEAAVLPQWGVVAVGGRITVVVDRSLDGTVGGGRVDLYTFRRVLGQRSGRIRPLAVGGYHIGDLTLTHLRPRELGGLTGAGPSRTLCGGLFGTIRVTSVR